ncbi:thiamine phosphate synthase [Aquamicrobium sp. NLF2-7]|uniref:thiamine phosphate synthase n=1 Tax=Aquamicrobium sp. NLF2-7 TaxID=2918753 RepID=UPI001EFBFEB6|nr:thiamine phosphate synthase [Aquamicrobium sp. NLF2-7]MCG8272818.1 thiamine phosphate synthase [Aquamicrobium sp. NLF2-7]
MNRVDYRLNAIIDGALRPLGNLAEMAGIAARSGATIIQYRDKEASTRQMIAEAEAIRAALAGTGVPLVVNDRVDVALAAGADGIHIGRDDMPAETARRLLGHDAIIGLTVKNEADADAAIAAPIDYACIGGVFETLSKKNPDAPVGLEGFSVLRARIRAAKPELLVGAIAGIDVPRTAQVVQAGASGVAVISAIFRAADIAAATRELRAAVDNAGGRP